MFRKFSAGVSFTGDTAHLAVLEIDPSRIRLRYLLEFARTGDDELWFLAPLLERGRRVIRKISKVSVALDNASVVLHSFPIDSVLGQVEQNEHVAWELGNYVPDFRQKGYINDTHLLHSHLQDKVSEIFVIAARRSLIFGIQEALAGRKFQLHITDTNHFGAQYALLVNYPEVKNRTAALAVLTPNRIDVGMLSQGRLIHYRYSPHSTTEEAIEFLHSQLQVHAADDIFFCGTSTPDDLIHGSEERLGMPVTMLNPFKRLTAGSSLDDFAGQEHRFASAVGCALRKQ